jgi:hypothetical protein
LVNCFEGCGNDFGFLFIGEITFDQDILDDMENEKLNEINLFRTTSGRIKKSI